MYNYARCVASPTPATRAADTEQASNLKKTISGNHAKPDEPELCHRPAPGACSLGVLRMSDAVQIHILLFELVNLTHLRYLRGLETKKLWRRHFTAQLYMARSMLS